MPRRQRAARPVVTLYTRTGCGLCERAGRLARREAGRGRFRTVDVDTDPDLVRRYGVRVPVITVDDVEVAEFELAPGQVRRAVRVARRSARRRA